LCRLGALTAVTAIPVAASSLAITVGLVGRSVCGIGALVLGHICGWSCVLLLGAIGRQCLTFFALTTATTATAAAATAFSLFALCSGCCAWQFKALLLGCGSRQAQCLCFGGNRFAVDDGALGVAVNAVATAAAFATIACLVNTGFGAFDQLRAILARLATAAAFTVALALVGAVASLSSVTALTATAFTSFSTFAALTAFASALAAFTSLATALAVTAATATLVAVLAFIGSGCNRCFNGLGQNQGGRRFATAKQALDPAKEAT
jgi:hypothetical protein